MKKLVKYMSPFAPDQSGACGVLYELGGITVICDAGGCAGNICGFDEPRWFEKKSAVFSAGLRDMDAIMGRDDKLIEKLADAQKTIGAKFTAIVGTPVPAVIATDMKALKRMAENKTGIPCITIECSGTRYYDVGEEAAWLAVFEEFARDKGSVKRGRVGVIGATPLETGITDGDTLINACKKAGYYEPVIYSVGAGLDDIGLAGECEKNLVVSAAGIKAAEYLKKSFGTPYELGFPFIPRETLAAAKELANKRVLIIHSQLAANKLRADIDNSCEVTCASWFTQKTQLMAENDVHLQSEDDLLDLAENGAFDAVIADGDMERPLRAAGFKGRLIPFPHFAISGIALDKGALD